MSNLGANLNMSSSWNLWLC